MLSSSTKSFHSMPRNRPGAFCVHAGGLSNEAAVKILQAGRRGGEGALASAKQPCAAPESKVCPPRHTQGTAALKSTTHYPAKRLCPLPRQCTTAAQPRNPYESPAFWLSTRRAPVMPPGGESAMLPVTLGVAGSLLAGWLAGFKPGKLPGTGQRGGSRVRWARTRRHPCCSCWWEGTPAAVGEQGAGRAAA